MKYFDFGMQNVIPYSEINVYLKQIISGFKLDGDKIFCRFCISKIDVSPLNHMMNHVRSIVNLPLHESEDDVKVKLNIKKIMKSHLLDFPKITEMECKEKQNSYFNLIPLEMLRKVIKNSGILRLLAPLHTNSHMNVRIDFITLIPLKSVNTIKFSKFIFLLMSLRNHRYLA